MYLTFISNIEKTDVLSVQSLEQQSDERQKMIDYITSYQNDKPSFGDAADWQNRERVDRELPFKL